MHELLRKTLPVDYNLVCPHDEAVNRIVPNYILHRWMAAPEH